LKNVFLCGIVSVHLFKAGYLMNKNKKKALLTALIVSLVLLVIAVASTLIFDYYMEYIQFDTLGMVIGHILGFLMMFCIVYKFEKKDDDEKPTDHNIY